MGNKIPRVLTTAIQLDFPRPDLRRFHWLSYNPRSYLLDRKPIGQGAFGTVYVCYPNIAAGRPLTQHKLVAKFANIVSEGHTEREIRERLARVQEKNEKEFSLIRKRLVRCRHANPIIDLASWFDGEFTRPVTIQRYLDVAVDLDRWLFLRGLRKEPARRNSMRRLVSKWDGIPSLAEWSGLSLAIASAIKDFHLRRVTHGDIHPGNIFMNPEGPLLVRLIDYGESFVATPGQNFRKRNGNPYLAPERIGARTILNERVDVYSFGILLLYLSTGIEADFASVRRVGAHRAHIHELIRTANQSLVEDEPRILDLIGRCTAKDPADRPKMTDVCEDLASIAGLGADHARPTSSSLGRTLSRISSKLAKAADGQSSAILRLLEREVYELERTVDGLRTEMVELDGTRDQLLRAMTALFDHLQAGDSWSTATTLSLWQRNALGLDGSYNGATIRAVRRGVSVRRTFLISVEELGRPFVKKLAQSLVTSREYALQRLGHLFEAAIREYDGSERREPPTDKFVEWHIERFIRLLFMIGEAVDLWKLTPFVALAKPVDIRTSSNKGFFLALCPVGTLDDVCAIKEDNPASIIHFAKEIEKLKWLLVMTEARGRHESRNGGDYPHLLGMRVFRSVQGEPRDRINYMEKLLNEKSVNIAGVAKDLEQIATAISRYHSPRRAAGAI